MLADYDYLTFEGWYLDKNYTKPWRAEDVITEDDLGKTVTVYAKWRDELKTGVDSARALPLSEEVLGALSLRIQAGETYPWQVKRSSA